ncbi:MAG: AAA family ATPase [Eubacteriales bacterium]
MRNATLYLMVGLSCSGKTTFAKRLADETGALLFSPDSWHISLFGHDMDHTEHDKRHDTVETLMWNTAQHILLRGVNVILDFGFWSRHERDTYREWANKAGINFTIYYMDTPSDELVKRLEQRNSHLMNDMFIFSPELLYQWMKLFEPPIKDEDNLITIK